MTRERPRRPKIHHGHHAEQQHTDYPARRTVEAWDSYQLFQLPNRPGKQPQDRRPHQRKLTKGCKSMPSCCGIAGRAEQFTYAIAICQQLSKSQVCETNGRHPHACRAEKTLACSNRHRYRVRRRIANGTQHQP